MNNDNDDSNNEEDIAYDDDDIFTDTSHKKKTYQVDFSTKNIEQITKMQIETIDQVSTLLGTLYNKHIRLIKYLHDDRVEK